MEHDSWGGGRGGKGGGGHNPQLIHPASATYATLQSEAKIDERVFFSANILPDLLVDTQKLII